MGKRTQTSNLFDYLDYRRYLRDLYAAQKKRRGAFSFRLFSKRAGFASPNFYKRVMEGERNLTPKSLPAFMQGLGLNKQEQEFFTSLVRYNQATSESDRNLAYRQLLQSRKYNQLKPLEKNQYEYCAEWYHPVVRELVTHPSFDGTPEWLSRHIFPPISPSQAKKSLEILECLGFIAKGEAGCWRQTSPLVATEAEVTSIALFNYHLKLLDLAKIALEKIPASQRDISALTLGLPRNKIPLLKEKIHRLHTDVMKIASVEDQNDEVIQLAIQMFPMTQLPERRP